MESSQQDEVPNPEEKEIEKGREKVAVNVADGKAMDPTKLTKTHPAGRKRKIEASTSSDEVKRSRGPNVSSEQWKEMSILLRNSRAKHDIKMKVQNYWGEVVKRMIVSRFDFQEKRQVLTTDCLQSLEGQSWLSNFAINHFIKLNVGEKNVYVMEERIVTRILRRNNKKHSKRSLLKRVDFANYDAILGLSDKNGYHWNLLVILPPSGKVCLFEPGGSNLPDSKVAAQKWRSYLKLRGKKSDQQCWSPVTFKHDTQKDGYNCGVIVMQAAVAILEKLPEIREEYEIDCSEKNLQKLRLEYACKIVRESDDLSKICGLCKNDINSHTVIPWVCGSCEMKFHSECLGVGDIGFRIMGFGSMICDQCLYA